MDLMSLYCDKLMIKRQLHSDFFFPLVEHLSTRNTDALFTQTYLILCSKILKKKSSREIRCCMQATMRAECSSVLHYQMSARTDCDGTRVRIFAEDAGTARSPRPAFLLLCNTHTEINISRFRMSNIFRTHLPTLKDG